MSEFSRIFDPVVQYIAEQVALGPPVVYYVRGTDFSRRVIKETRISTAAGIPAMEAVQQSLRNNQRKELDLIARAIKPTAIRVAPQFHLVVDDLVDQTLQRVIGTITRSFEPPFSGEGPEALFNRLRGYLQKPVYFTAKKMKVRPDCNLSEVVQDKLDPDLGAIAAIDRRDFLRVAWARLRPWLDDEDLRRLEAFMRWRTIVEAAREVGITPAAFRQWLFKLRQLVQRLMGDLEDDYDF